MCQLCHSDEMENTELMRVQTKAGQSWTDTMPGRFGMVGDSPIMHQLFQQINIVAKAQGPVLITGESGTGKELVAQALHQQSDRAEAPFLVVNCAGIPQELLETEFFGHVKGAFTGAGQSRTGLLQQAHGGTLFLDEIGDMPIALQAKLLRALQDGSVRPVGHNTEDQVDVRIMAATHSNLRQKVAEGVFREDLFYRLETFVIDLPPLRERGKDKELLAEMLLKQLADDQSKAIEGFSAEAIALLHQYDFPGNIRELQNLIERAVAFCDGGQIEASHLSLRLNQNHTFKAAGYQFDQDDLLAGPALPTLAELQQRYVRKVLDEVGGNKRQAATMLGIGRKTLYRWLE